jgi:hypothetical protein
MSWSPLRKFIDNTAFATAPRAAFGTQAAEGSSTRRTRHIVTGTLVGSVALSLGSLPGVAGASTTIGLNLTAEAVYSCPVSCATATTGTIFGVAHSQDLGRITESIAFTVLSIEANGCALQSEKWVLTAQKGRSMLFLSTTSDTICPTANSNMLVETGTLAVAGGTGLFTNATGDASFMWAVLVQPQVGGGALTGTVTS